MWTCSVRHTFSCCEIKKTREQPPRRGCCRRTRTLICAGGQLEAKVADGKPSTHTCSRARKNLTQEKPFHRGVGGSVGVQRFFNIRESLWACVPSRLVMVQAPTFRSVFLSGFFPAGVQVLF